MCSLALGDAKVVYFGGVSRDATDDDVKALVSTAGKVTNFEVSRCRRASVPGLCSGRSMCILARAIRSFGDCAV